MTKKKITKEQALRWCRDLWKWIEKHPNKNKNKWQGWNNRKHCACYCPCCQYRNEYALSCRECLLISLWPNRCENEPSPYLNWLNIHDANSARKIWMECERLLTEMKK